MASKRRTKKTGRSRTTGISGSKTPVTKSTRRRAVYVSARPIRRGYRRGRKTTFTAVARRKAAPRPSKAHPYRLARRPSSVASRQFRDWWRIEMCKDLRARRDERRRSIFASGRAGRQGMVPRPTDLSYVLCRWRK